MKKLLFTLLAAFMCISASAQEKNTWKNTKSFLGSCKYEIIAGYCTTVASAPFDNAVIGFNLGVTGRKDIKTFKNDKFAINGIVGLTLTRRGGKTSTDLMDIEAINWKSTALSLPIHAGAEYRLKKVSIFADLGPNLIFGFGGDIDNIKTNACGVGAGFNLGVRFKKFGISFGVDEDFTNFGTFTPDKDQKDHLDLDKDKYGLKTGEFHFDLRWTI